MKHLFARKSRLTVAAASSFALVGILVQGESAVAAAHSAPPVVRTAAPLAAHTSISLTVKPATAGQDGGYDKKGAAPSGQDGGYDKKGAAPSGQDGGYDKKGAAPSGQDGGYGS